MFDRKKYQRERYHRRRRELIDQMGGECIVCGEKENLEFDHIKSRDKEFDVSRKLVSANIETIKGELTKCQLLCKVCHRVKTVANGEQGGGANKITELVHGTGKAYTYFRCKCEECREWKRKARVGKKNNGSVA